MALVTTTISAAVGANDLVIPVTSATGMAASSEAIAMGVKAGLDPSLMCDVINAGSGMNTSDRKSTRLNSSH